MTGAFVTIKRGSHGHPVPQGASRFIEQQLEERGIEGTFSLMWGPNVKGTQHSPRFKSFGIKGNNIEVLVKPGDNGTAHVCWLSPSDGYPMTLEELQQMLGTDIESEPPVTPAPIPFCNDSNNVDSFLRLLAARGGTSAIGDLVNDCNVVFGVRSRKGWGRILGSLRTMGLITTEGTPHGKDSNGEVRYSIDVVTITPNGLTRVPMTMRTIDNMGITDEVTADEVMARAVPASPFSNVMIDTEPAPAVPAMDGGMIDLFMVELTALNDRLGKKEDDLTMRILALDDEIQKKRDEWQSMMTESQLMRAKLDIVTKRRAATNVLLTQGDQK